MNYDFTHNIRSYLKRYRTRKGYDFFPQIVTTSTCKKSCHYL
jgi:hypothetical protein